jgi:hypothetical protein
MASDARVSVETLKLALRGLEDGFGGREKLSADEQERFLTAVAEAALDALAVALKYLLANNGNVTVPGFGTIAASASSMHCAVTLDEDAEQYLAAMAPDRASGTADLIAQHARLAANLLEERPYVLTHVLSSSGMDHLARFFEEPGVTPVRLDQALDHELSRINAIVEAAKHREAIVGGGKDTTWIARGREVVRRARETAARSVEMENLNIEPAAGEGPARAEDE